MKIRLLLSVLLLCLNPNFASAAAADIADGQALPSSQYLSVNVDRVVIDITGLQSAASTLSGSVDRLAQAIGQLSAENVNLSEEQKQHLLAAVDSVDKAGLAIADLAEKLPHSAQDLSEQLPGVINAVHEPLAELRSSLETVLDGIHLITESLPQATENAKQLVNATLDSAVRRLSIYTAVLVAALAIALIGILWFIYWQYIGPLVRKLDELVGTSQHFDSMSRHMKETSDNLLALQRVKPRGAERFRRP